MIPTIGSDILFDGSKFHVQDTNHLSLTARIGIPDARGIVWETRTVAYEDIKPLEPR